MSGCIFFLRVRNIVAFATVRSYHESRRLRERTVSKRVFRPETSFGRTVGMTAKAFRKSVSRHLAESGEDISVDQFVALMNLLVRDGLYHQEVAELVDRDKTATTRIVDALEGRNLVVRVPDEDDRRQKKIHLTPEGKQTCHRLGRVAEATQTGALADIEPERLDTCREVLKQVLENLNRIESE